MGDGRWKISAATAALAAALTVHPARRQNAPPPTPQPAATTAPTPGRSLDPAIVLRAPTSTQAEREEAARRLVQRQNPAARDVLLTALQDIANRSGQIAAAKALSIDPNLDARFIAPLFAAVGNGNDQLTDAAIAALSNFRNDTTITARLLEVAADTRQQPAIRKAAIKAIGQMSDKPAAQTLIRLLGDVNEPQPMRDASCDALADMTGLPPTRDPAQWAQWWAQAGKLPEEQFERELLAARAVRLKRLQEHFDRVVAEAQELLTRVYQATPEKSREAVLLDYLRAREPETRLVGVRLVREDFNISRLPSPAARDELRRMVGDSSATVRVAVANALTLLNDAGAIPAILEQLNEEPEPDVRAELARTLAPTRDLRVVDPLLKLLKDPSPTVIQVAADGLRELGPLIQKDAALSNRVANELQAALQSSTPLPGGPTVRAALIDAMGALQNPELRNIYTRLLNPREPVPVRRAALRSLGKLQQPWAAEIIVNAVDDPDDDVRLEAINALDTTASFSQAEKLYSVVKSPSEKPAIRQRAWTVLKNRFPDPTASNDALSRWAERFKDEPDRRIEILEVLAQRLTAAKNGDALVLVQQNIGEAKMKLSSAALQANDPQRAQAGAQEADKYFESALAYYAKNPRDEMILSALIEQRMDALLASRQYSKAADFAASYIASNSPSQEALSRKLRNEIDRLRTAKQYADAIALIDAVNQMNPKLREPFAGSIKTIEQEVRQRQATKPRRLRNRERTVAILSMGGAGSSPSRNDE